jgi:tetratricopeptide (TPR) repeat protein
VTGGDRQRALEALHEARPAIGRMDLARGPEHTASDLREGWRAVEHALDALSGQSLIREARQRQLIAFEQANALAELEAAYVRGERPGYTTTDADVNAARNAFLKLETALMHEGATGGAPAAWTPLYTSPGPVNPATPATHGTSTVPSPGAARSAPAGPGPTPSVAPGELQPLMREGRQPWLVPVIALVVLVAVGAGIYFAVSSRGGSDSLTQGVQYMQQGQREAATGAFTKAARENPRSAMPHVYLSRLYREAGNMTIAGEEAQRAVQAEPGNAIALREMGSFLLASGNAELARRFYVRAIQADSTDRSAMGWLGCSLMRLNRVDEAQRWMTRAGAGDWSRCTPMAPGAMPPPPGMTGIPR